MAITIAGSALSTNATTTSYVFTTASTLGHTPATGSLVVVAIKLQNNNISAAPSGWTSDLTADKAGTNLVYLYSRIITGSEASTYTWTWASADAQVAVWEASAGGGTWQGYDTGVSYTGAGSLPLAIGSTATLATATEVAFLGGSLGSPATTGPGISGGGTWALLTAANVQFVFGSLITTATTALSPTITGSGTNVQSAAAGTYTLIPAVNPSFTGLLNVGGTVNPTFTGLLNVAGKVNPSFTGLLNVGGSFPHGWTVATQVAWGKNPLTRPTEGLVGAGGDWSNLTDVSDGVTALNIKRGTKILSTGLETGTANFTADNRQRALDPSYAASPYYPNVVPRRRLRHVLKDAAGNVLKVLHTGFIERYQTAWTLKNSTVKVPTQDLFGILAGVTLPPSVLDYTTRGLTPANYWPLGEPAGVSTFDDVVGTKPGVYNFQLQSSGVLTAYDPRQAPVCARPTGAYNLSQNMVVTPYSVPQQVTLCGWFRWQPGDDVIMRPTLFQLQDTSSPLTFTNSSGHYTLSAFIRHAATGDDYATISIVTRDTAGFNQKDSLLSYHMLDGTPHMFAVAWDGTNNTVTAWVDGVPQAGWLVDHASPSIALSSINTGAALSHATLWAGGWGIVWDSASAAANSAQVGQFSVFNRLLTNTEVASMWNAGASAWSGDRTDQRLTKICDLIGIDANDRSFDTGTQTCGPTTLGSQNVMSYLKKIVATEAGVCYVNGDGKIRFRARPSSPAVVQVFSDDPVSDAGVPCNPLAPDFSYDRVVNTLVVSREGGLDQRVNDATSVATYGALAGASGGKLDTLAPDQTTAKATGSYVVNAHKDWVAYIPTVKVEGIDRGVSQAALIGVEVGDNIAVVARPTSPTVAPLSVQALNESVEYNFPSPTQIEVTYSPGDGVVYP